MFIPLLDMIQVSTHIEDMCRLTWISCPYAQMGCKEKVRTSTNFLVKIYFSFREMIFFVQPLKYANFHREDYPSCVTSYNEYTWPSVFLSTYSFVLSSNINPLSLLKLAKKFFFLVNVFVRHTFPLSNSSIKTKTVLTMTDMIESTDLKAFERQKDG